MKKSFLLMLLMLAVVLPVAAQSPSRGFEEELHKRHKVENTVKFQADVNVGFITGGKLATKNLGKLKTNLSRPYIETILGARLGEFMFAGVGLGAQYAYGECNLISIATANAPDKWGALMLPLYANVRGYIPTRNIVKPYISASLGGHFVPVSNFCKYGYGRIKGGLLMKFGAGLNISKFNFGLGYSAQNLEWINTTGQTMFKAGNSAFYIETGVTF